MRSLVWFTMNCLKIEATWIPEYYLDIMADCYCDIEYCYQQNFGQKLESHCSFQSQLFDYFSIRFIWSSALESLPEKEGLENNWDNPKLLLTTQLLEGTQTVPKSSQGQGQGLCHHFDEEGREKAMQWWSRGAPLLPAYKEVNGCLRAKPRAE